MLATTRFVALALVASALGVVSASAQHAQHAHGSGDVGTVMFPTSCDPKVQADFERAVAMLHSFWFEASTAAFNGVVATDPGCAMAHWGIAWTISPTPISSRPRTRPPAGSSRTCVPARELLAELLLDLGRPADALREFEATLTVEPNRFRALAGAARAAERAGDTTKARHYHQQLVTVAAGADSERPELQQARAVLGR